ncbi:phosphotransferase [Gordonia rhizosphera]|uniref:CHK kinase-like domain-containing protein n=1 Tax=Gordonia rhizosphera NBRC 16068 TaxID=1108045 RepID=K6V5D0_9ACTN|nr:phosphotransferase [Gordonia rhizosphera]GAB91418.1 hypothetical protein GORHZ_131_00050 [Gordonia rhizosphera NBRC 16068]
MTTATPTGGNPASTATPIPVSVDELTAEYLTRLLRTAGHDVIVETVSARPVGSGQMASSYRLTLGYRSDDTPLPDTLVAKLATGPIDQRLFVVGAYRNEIRFYREIADTVDAPTPTAYASEISDEGTEFVLLLEDMTPAEQGDQILGAGPEVIKAVAVGAAGLHAPRWCDDTLASEHGLGLPTQEDADAMQEFLAPMADAFRERFDLGEREAAALDYLVANARDWLIAPRPHFSIIHSDLRVDNVLFAPDGEVTIVDWQTISAGSPLRDISFLLSTSLDIEDRRLHERDIVAAYHAELLRRGVSDYSFQQCWDDYVDGLLHTMLIVVFGAGAAKPTERGDTMFMTMLSRGAVAIDDLIPGALS